MCTLQLFTANARRNTTNNQSESAAGGAGMAEIGGFPDAKRESSIECLFDKATKVGKCPNVTSARAGNARPVVPVNHVVTSN